MFDNTASVFRCVAIGIAAENKQLGSKELVVTPHEKLPFVDGELVNKVDTLDYESQDKDGKVISGTSFVSNDITATWLPETNRKTAPDIRRGEYISLWQFGSNDKYYWRSMGLNDDLRRLETVIWAINANPSESQDGFDPENMYFVEFSSHTKMVTFSTSKMNGEYCTYDFQFDMANGKVVLQDDLGNYSFIDSKNTHFRMENMLGTYIEMNKQFIKGYAPKDIDLEAGNNFNLKCKKATLDGGGSILTLEAPGTTLATKSFKGKST